MLRSPKLTTFETSILIQKKNIACYGLKPTWHKTFLSVIEINCGHFTSANSIQFIANAKRPRRASTAEQQNHFITW